MQNDFIVQKPHNHFLSSLIDTYFFIDLSIDALTEVQEYVVPFPRITFGYFFDHPFLVTNHDLGQSKKADMLISRISAQKITVLPLTNRIKIIGAHVKPYALAYFTKEPIHKLPWIIETADLFGRKANSFREGINVCTEPKEMFDQVEKIFLDTLLIRNLETITQAVELIEERKGDIKLSELAYTLNLTDRALRDQFNKHIGCSPKEFIKLLQLKNAVHQMNFSKESLTDITYDNNYFDQAHFINSFKKITGKTPKDLRNKMSDFRFLQF